MYKFTHTNMYVASILYYHGLYTGEKTEAGEVIIFP